MNLILPLAGLSSRFPGMKPKWLLTHPNGNLMITEAIKGLDLSLVKNIYLVVLKQHLDGFDVERHISDQFKEFASDKKIVITVLDEPTKNQPETVYQAITRNNIQGSIFIKDCDNYFTTKIEHENSVCVFNLNDMDLVHARNKSYAVFDHTKIIKNIVEKKVVSSDFCVGGYSFESSDIFIEYFNKLKEKSDLYISHLIYQMILDGLIFKASQASNYIDWGTLVEWNRYKSQYATLFVDLDGTLVKNSGQFFEPHWGTTKGISDNVTSINKLHEGGKVQIILTTARKEEYRDATIKQLRKEGIKYHQIIFGLYHGKRIVINDYAKTNPYKSCDAINIKRDSSDLKEMLEESLGFPI